MKNNIKTIHEEYYLDSNKSTSVSVLVTTYNNEEKVYFLYFQNQIYTVFKTIFDCVKFVVSGSDSIMRGYIDEDNFDELYDNGLEKSFEKYVEWVEIKNENL